MKKLLAAMFVALLMAGCGGPDLDDKETLDKVIAEAIDMDTLQKRGKKGEELLYAPNQQSPYTGWAKEMYDNGQIKDLGQVKDGKADGLYTRWYENGQKKWEQTFKDGKPWTAVGWKPNGEKCPVTNIVDGNGVLVWYDDDGTEFFRTTFKNGKPDLEQTAPPP